jgi:formate hydrogenlyase subunit 6/NADH:ubiquinone oxidoreductase subunit I
MAVPDKVTCNKCGHNMCPSSMRIRSERETSRARGSESHNSVFKVSYVTCIVCGNEVRVDSEFIGTISRY